jgi:hypothetical protein
MNGHTLIEHGGAWQGFTCDIRRYVDDHLTVVVLANLAGARTNLIADKVAQLANPALAPKPHPVLVGFRAAHAIRNDNVWSAANRRFKSVSGHHDH